MAAVSSQGPNSIVLEKVDKKNPGSPWKCVITRSDGDRMTSICSSWEQAFGKLVKYLLAAAGGRAEDVYLVAHNFAGFDLPILLSCCEARGIVMPNFSILDTLPLSHILRGLVINKRDLGSMVRQMFPSSTFRYKPFLPGDKYTPHTSHEDATMALMCSWHLLSVHPGASAGAKCLGDVVFAAGIMQRITTLSSAVNDFRSKYLRSCLIAVTRMVKQ